MSVNIISEQTTSIRTKNTKKFNEVQINEFLRIKNFMLDFLYTYYSSYMSDLNEQEKINNEIEKVGFHLVLGDITERIIKKKYIISPKDYFTNDELKEIEIAIENQEKYQDIMNKAPIEFKLHLNGNISQKYEGISTEEQKYARDNFNRMELLDVYNAVINYGYKVVLRQEIDKTLSVLPFEVYNRLVKLIDIFPNPNWMYESEESFSYDNNYDIDDATPIMVNENEIDKISRTELNNSINNRVMNIHKVFNEIMKDYID